MTNASELRMLEHEAVRRILFKAGLSRQVNCGTLEELVMQIGFPLRLVMHKFRPKALDDLDFDMMRRPTKAPLIMAIDEIFEQNSGVQQCDLGMIFPWQGHGGLYVLTNDMSLPTQSGTSGRFWQLRGMYYLLEPIDSFVGRLGPPEDW